MAGVFQTAWMKIEGLKELESSLSAMEDVAKGKRILRKAARIAMRPVVDTAKGMVSIRTGQLRDSIKLTVRAPKSGSVVLEVGIKIGKMKIKDEVTEINADGSEGETSKVTTKLNAWYWRFVEFGTVRSTPKPFLRPAMEQRKEQVISVFGSEMAKALEKAAKTRKGDT